MSRFIIDGTEAFDFLKMQHVQIRTQFANVLAETGEAREAEFHHLRRMLAVHETAEELVVHPAARKVAQVGDPVVEARLAEEHQAKERLRELESLDRSSSEFATKLLALRDAVVAHAEAEEAHEFLLMKPALSDNQIASMRRTLELAEALAPTRPHVGVGESALANFLVGPFAAMLDRTRDYIVDRT